ncbi:MAG: hypothetical protein MUO54_01910, partial [Anaerolineales bacterium]|nr:hypothetical protein [Anaerolineales bacterium]
MFQLHKDQVFTLKLLYQAESTPNSLAIETGQTLFVDKAIRRSIRPYPGYGSQEKCQERDKI